MVPTTVFIVSEYSAIRDSIAELVVSAGMPAETFSTLEEWHSDVPPNRKGCLVLDTQDSDYASALPQANFNELCTLRSVLLLVDRGDVPFAVRAIKHGAVDVLEKPCSDLRLLSSIERALVAMLDSDAAE